jgi:hypothetical protein
MLSSVQRLQGNFTLHISHLPSPALLPVFALLLLSLGLLPFFPPLRLLHPFFLFPHGFWLSFKLANDCIECTSTDWVGLEDTDVVGPPVDWIKENNFNWFVTESVNFTLAEPTMPST